MQQLHIEGHGRDVYTHAQGSAPEVLALDGLQATMSHSRTIESIETTPARSSSAQLVGERGGGYLRQALNEALPAEREAGSPLYLLIDDLSGASLVSGWAWTRWRGPDAPPEFQLTEGELSKRIELVGSMENICTGFRTGSSALNDPEGKVQNSHPVVVLPNPADPAGWHEMPQHTAPAMRRSRRIDVWQDGLIHIDAMFQDSATTPEGGRCAVHEYTFQATVDPESMKLLTVQAQPRILPYRECPAAIENLGRLAGTPMRELRRVVLEQLGRKRGCTHLNDAMRSLAETPMLVQHLARRSGRASTN